MSQPGFPRYVPPCACGCEAERLPTVGYWAEARMEYPGGGFSGWAVCGNGTLLTLIGAMAMIKRYRDESGQFRQFRLRGAVPSLPHA